jgi:signal transduction histidine kinase
MTELQRYNGCWEAVQEAVSMPSLSCEEKAGKVLIVEDELEILEPLAHSLRKAGFTVLIAEDGLSACRIIGKEKPDLILLDIMLPDLDGWEVCRMLRQHPDPVIASIPVIMLTALGTPENKYRGLELGADLFLPKPYSIREVILLSGKFVGNRQKTLTLQNRLEKITGEDRQNHELHHMLFHELSNQLHILNGFTELLHENPASERAGACMDAIYRSSNYLQALAEEILLIRQVEDGRLSLAYEHFPIDALIGEIIEVYNTPARCKDVQLRYLIAEKQPTVNLSRLALKIILSALVDNSLKFGPAGQTITLSCEPAADRFILMVADQGPGIHADEQERIFEPYYRVESVASKPRGRGLGLYGAHVLAKAMGGTVMVESQAGVGSCFRIDLPVAASTS